MTQPSQQEEQPGHEPGDQEQVLTSSAVMAVGTMVSRFSGYLRSLLLAAALGNLLHADLFTIGNTVPNMLYILLAGGVFNAVLVPQLVRSMKADPDGGEAYTNRVITLAALFLGAVSVVLVAAAPWLMDVFLSSDYDRPELSDQRESIVAFARYCLPQVFFYGMFALVGQVLNARRRFGPMMWAPIANNLVSIAVLVAYLLRYGPVGKADLSSAYTPGQEAWLGLGATAGIAVQLLVLLPFLRAAGVQFRPRFDFRGTGLGHTLRLGLWTVLFVAVNQVAYAIVVRLASSGTAQSVGRSVGQAAGSGGAETHVTGYTIYAQTFLIVMVPHSVITVSLATAMLPLLSAHGNAGDLRALGSSLARVMRTALAVVVPFALLLPVVAPDLASILWNWGAASSTYHLYILSLSLFGAGVVFFTVHYLVLRGFYALERTRTVFLIQCVVAGTNIVAAVVLVAATDAVHTAPALVAAYTASYVVGSVLSYLVLRRTLAGDGPGGSGGLASAVLVRFLVRLLIATGVATFAAWGLATLLPGRDDPSHLVALVRLVAVAAADILVFLVLARLTRLSEVNEVIDTVTRRLRRRTRAG
jgi:putative peptidoglycan lipid II flippase